MLPPTIQYTTHTLVKTAWNLVEGLGASVTMLVPTDQDAGLARKSLVEVMNIESVFPFVVAGANITYKRNTGDVLIQIRVGTPKGVGCVHTAALLLDRPSLMDPKAVAEAKMIPTNVDFVGPITITAE